MGRVAREDGIGGDRPLWGRRGRGDGCGDGYAYPAASTPLDATRRHSTPLDATARMPLDRRDAWIIATHARCRQASAIEVTPNVQWADEMRGKPLHGDGAIVAGVRLSLKH